MVVKVPSATGFQFTQPILPHSQTVAAAAAAAVSSPSIQRCGRSDGFLICRFVNRLDAAAVFGNPSSCLFRSRSCDILKPRSKNLKRVCAAGLDSFSSEEFSKQMRLKFQVSDENYSRRSSSRENESSRQSRFSWTEIQRESPEWERPEELIPAIIERKANSVELPLSLRLIRRKLRLEEGFREAGESAYCSVKKAFSSMVFIIQELHSYTLQMRELLFYEDLQGILVKVQKEMHASFVWLFQQVFSHTPTLMVYVMILLANYSVHSMSSTAAFAASPPPPATYETVVQVQGQTHKTLDSSSVKTFSLSSSSGGKTTSIGGNNGGGGGKIRPVSSGTEGDGCSDGADQFRTIVPHGTSQLSSIGSSSSTRETESTSGEEEMSLWNSLVHEAEQTELDHETMQRFVSPVTARIPDGEEISDYTQTEHLYRIGLAQDRNNALLMANYAQFLYLVVHDNDRAEEYFKKAVAVDPPDAEALNKYATFLWRARNDLWAAEETFLEAISAEPTNSFYAANYAHFLWNTGGDDTCFPLNSPDDSTAQEI